MGRKNSPRRKNCSLPVDLCAGTSAAHRTTQRASLLPLGDKPVHQAVPMNMGTAALLLTSFQLNPAEGQKTYPLFIRTIRNNLLTLSLLTLSFLAPFLFPRSFSLSIPLSSAFSLSLFVVSSSGFLFISFSSLSFLCLPMSLFSVASLLFLLSRALFSPTFGSCLWQGGWIRGCGIGGYKCGGDGGGGGTGDSS